MAAERDRKDENGFGSVGFFAQPGVALGVAGLNVKRRQR